MKKYNLFSLLSVFALLLSLQSCEIAGDIFKAGIWVGIIVVVGIIILLVRLFTGKK